MKRRTKKQYADLFQYPGLLFKDVETTIYPNGQSEIWFKTKDGLGFSVKVSNGPAGLGLRVSRFIGGPEMTVTEDFHGEVSLVQYRQDERSQAYKRWYRGEETEDDIKLLGEDYRRKKQGSRQA